MKTAALAKATKYHNETIAVGADAVEAEMIRLRSEDRIIISEDDHSD
jgi:hypothetical protein